MEPISAVIAGLLALAGVVAVLAGLFADRSRGRRRCVACGYVMDGLESQDDPLRCPECGRVAASERTLYRTRRRPRRVIAGVLIVLLACAVAAWSRWEAAGPAALPGPVLVRLTVLDRTDIQDEIIRRIDGGLLDGGELRVLAAQLIDDAAHTDASRSAFAEKAIDRLVLWVTRPAREGEPEPEPERRVVAAVLGPYFAARLLDHPDPAVRREAVTWCATLASRSVPAQHALLSAPADPDPGVAQAAVSSLTYGSKWVADGVVPDDVARQISFGRMSWLGERIARWIRERPATPETMRTLARHLIDPGIAGAEYLDGYGEVELGIGLLLCLDGPTDAVFEELIVFADPRVQGMRALTTLRYLAVFEWRGEMAPVLLAAIGYGDWEVSDAGWDILEHFGTDASIEPDALLTVIRSPGVDANKRAAEYAAANGVPRSALREAGLGVLRAQLAVWREQGGEPFEIDGHEVAFGGGVVDWIADYAEQGGTGVDEEVASVLRELAFDTEPGVGCRVAGAYLEASGDREGVTRFVLGTYGQLIDGEFDALDRRTSNRISSAMRSLIFNPELDADAVIAWVGEDPIRAGHVLSVSGSNWGRLASDTETKIETLLKAFEHLDGVGPRATRMLEQIDAVRERARTNAEAP